MYEHLPLLTGAAAIVVFVLLFLPRPPRVRGHIPNRKSGMLKKLRHSGCYRGVTVRPGQCAAVRHFSGRHFGFDEAPSLPLDGCHALHCSCSYQGLPEQRKHARRHAPDRRDSIRFDAGHPQRRSVRERRRGHVRWLDPQR